MAMQHACLMGWQMICPKLACKPLAFGLFPTFRCSQCGGRERPCSSEPGGNSRPDMCGRRQPHRIWHVLLGMAGERSDPCTKKHRHSLNKLLFFRLAFHYSIRSYRLSLAFLNAEMHHISLALTILPPHLSLLHTQPKSRKIAFITAAWLKGTFVNVAWSLYLLMPSPV